MSTFGKMQTLTLLMCMTLAVATSVNLEHLGKTIPIHIPTQTVISNDTLEVPSWLGAYYATVEINPTSWTLPLTIGNGGQTYPGEFLIIRNYGPYDITLYSQAPETIEGSSSYFIPAENGVEIISGYPNWVVVGVLDFNNHSAITDNSTVSCWLSVGNSNPTNKRCGDTTSLRFFGDTSSSTTSDPSTLLFTPATGTQAYRIGGADGSGIQGGPTRRLLMYGANSIELRGGLNTATPPSFLAASGADPGVRIVNTDASRAVLRLIGASSQAGDYLQVRDSAGAVVALMDSGGHLGLAGKTNPSNAWIYIGSGTGSLVDNSPMGMKVKLDTTISTRPDGIQSNINIVSGAAGSGSVRGVLSRIDLNDQTSTGDTVALWGDVIVSGNNTSRNTWGLNSFVVIGSSSSPGSVTYSQGAIGAEIQVANFGSTGNVGGAIHAASAGTQTIRFALKLNSGGNPMSSGLDGTNNIEHFILAADDTLANGQTGRGPGINFIYYGPLNADNTPTGTAKFKVDKTGRVDSAASINGVGLFDSGVRVVRSCTAGAGITCSVTDGVITVAASIDLQSRNEVTSLREEVNALKAQMAKLLQLLEV